MHFRANMVTMVAVVRAGPDFSFEAIVASHGWRQLAPFVWDSEQATLTTAITTPDKATAALCLCETAGGVLAEVTGGSLAPGDAIATTRRMLQMDRDLSAFHAYCRTVPELAHVPKQRLGRMLRSPTLFEDLVKVIATTNTTWTQTIAMVNRLVSLGAPVEGGPVCLGALVEGGLASLGAPVEGGPVKGGLVQRAFPTPAQIAAIDAAEFGWHVRMGYRSAHVHRIASEIISGALDLDELERMGPDRAVELWRRLLALPGVGPYAAACVMLLLGHSGEVHVDSWARTLLARQLGRPVTNAEVHAYFSRHAPWEALAYQFWRWE